MTDQERSPRLDPTIESERALNKTRPPAGMGMVGANPQRGWERSLWSHQWKQEKAVTLKQAGQKGKSRRLSQRQSRSQSRSSDLLFCRFINKFLRFFARHEKQ